MFGVYGSLCIDWPHKDGGQPTPHGGLLYCLTVPLTLTIRLRILDVHERGVGEDVALALHKDARRQALCRHDGHAAEIKVCASSPMATHGRRVQERRRADRADDDQSA